MTLCRVTSSGWKLKPDTWPEDRSYATMAAAGRWQITHDHNASLKPDQPIFNTNAKSPCLQWDDTQREPKGKYQASLETLPHVLTQSRGGCRGHRPVVRFLGLCIDPLSRRSLGSAPGEIEVFARRWWGKRRVKWTSGGGYRRIIEPRVHVVDFSRASWCLSAAVFRWWDFILKCVGFICMN